MDECKPPLEGGGGLLGGGLGDLFGGFGFRSAGGEGNLTAAPRPAPLTAASRQSSTSTTSANSEVRSKSRVRQAGPIFQCGTTST